MSSHSLQIAKQSLTGGCVSERGVSGRQTKGSENMSETDVSTNGKSLQIHKGKVFTRSAGHRRQNGILPISCSVAKKMQHFCLHSGRWTCGQHFVARKARSRVGRFHDLRRWYLGQKGRQRICGHEGGKVEREKIPFITTSR